MHRSVGSRPVFKVGCKHALRILDANLASQSLFNHCVLSAGTLELRLPRPRLVEGRRLFTLLSVHRSLLDIYHLHEALVSKILQVSVGGHQLLAS